MQHTIGRSDICCRGDVKRNVGINEVFHIPSLQSGVYAAVSCERQSKPIYAPVVVIYLPETSIYTELFNM